MPIDPNAKVSDVALTVPGAPRILDELHVDYCCHGSQSLSEACAEAGVPMSVAVALLEGEPELTHAAVDAGWVDGPLPDLIDYIERKHHPFTRAEIVRLPNLAAKVTKAHCAEHAELARLEQLLRALAAELGPHLDKEERVVFPAVRALVRVGAAAAPDIGPPLAVMRHEHDAVADLLREIRRTTDEYELPPDACPSFKVLYDGIEGLDRDIRYHVHLENNVLFPRALALAGDSDGAC